MSNKADFLLELLVEEIPARFQATAIANVERLMLDGLIKNKINHENVRAYVSPRRLVFSARMDRSVPEFFEEKKGPQTSASANVIEQFLKSIKSTRSDLSELVIDGKTFLLAKIKHPEQQTHNLLGTIVKNMIVGVPWPKSMHWGSSLFKFVRPLRNILCVFDGKIVDAQIEDIGLKFTDSTVGHRFMANKRIQAFNVDDYLDKMQNAFVIVDHTQRKKIILDECRKLDKNVCITDDLLDEVVGLVEYPVVLVGRAPEKFMKLPEEVIVTTMRAYQRYFPTKIDGNIPYFVFVANNIAEDGGKTIIAGNERVLNARLADALFFFETDLQKPLESQLENLKKIVFNEKLGTVFDRITRISAIGDDLAVALNLPDDVKSRLKRATKLAKCDLCTNMVCELTELQGIMGAHYARIQGETPEICAIIRDQYKTVDELSSFDSAIFSFADRMDLISSLFAIGKEPTGSKDPFALRRAAIGLLKIILKYNIDINLKNITENAFNRLNSQINGLNQNTVKKIMSFVMDRLKIIMKENGFQHDVIQAIVAVNDNPLEIYQKAEVLNEMLKNKIGEKLISMYKRTKNIIQNNSNVSVDEAELIENDEKKLLNAIKKLENSLSDIEKSNHKVAQKFQKKLETCIIMEDVLASFFDNVFVNADNETIRRNRINMITKFAVAVNKSLPEISNFA